MSNFTCVRSVGFTCDCDEEGNSTNEQLRAGLIQRIADIEVTLEWQQACGQDATDIQPKE